MEHNRKQKLLVIVSLIVGIASLSIGFAAFSVSLNISSSASVTPSSDTFSVKFSNSPDNLVEGRVDAAGYSTGITPYNAVIDNSGNPVVKGFGATFTEPGQFVEYGVYARNEGEYTAYLNNVNFIGKKVCTAESETTDSLVQAACDYIDITVRVGDATYSETTSVSGHALASGQSELIYIYIEYGNGPSVDGPFSITFSDIAFVYSTIDDSTIKPDVVRVESGDVNTIGSIVSIGNEQFYVFGQDEENNNVKLLSMYNLHVGNYVSLDDDGNVIVAPLSNPTGIQSSDAVGGLKDSSNNPIDYPYVGVTEFSSESQSSSVEMSDYEGSIVEGYVNNYASYLMGLGANIVEARLITKDELLALGCVFDTYSCLSAPEFVYQTHYWADKCGPSMRWVVSRRGKAAASYCDRNDFVGIRPVIEIPLSEF